MNNDKNEKVVPIYFTIKRTCFIMQRNQIQREVVGWGNKNYPEPCAVKYSGGNGYTKF